ncbi:multidrug DMT transporter permease [Pseudoalteromonas undina]|uniref:DMT family transporter n=1 Tax=Pseudoalteromonas undina TaxID=43660 RepID=UPI0006BB3783|nr:DMT family transporter [Pseudoalteromonas undina]KPH92177.1 multidrug DMT transporter permease [Pseudoalteromonas undina]
MKATLFTIIALVAFAANSLLCRLALAQGYIDAWNFTVIRLLSGAMCLAIIMLLYTKQLNKKAQLSSSVINDTGSWRSSVSLLIYALCFSVAYIELDTGMGALILFSAVQFTMIGWGIYKQERLTAVQWLAFIVAFVAFIYLMLPSQTAPPLMAAVLMSISGVAWGIYSIRGKACVSPLRATTYNFIRSLLVLPILIVVGMSQLKNIRMEGVLLAIGSGAIASGVGYSIWYVAMPLLKSTHAAIVQLCVPVLAAIAGAVFLSETLTVQFMLPSSIILLAVLVFTLNKKTNTA